MVLFSSIFVFVFVGSPPLPHLFTWDKIIFLWNWNSYLDIFILYPFVCSCSSITILNHISSSLLSPSVFLLTGRKCLFLRQVCLLSFFYFVSFRLRFSGSRHLSLSSFLFLHSFMLSSHRPQTSRHPIHTSNPIRQTKPISTQTRIYLP